MKNDWDTIKKRNDKIWRFTSPNIVSEISLFEPWLVWLGGLSAGLQTKGSLIGFPVRACDWVAGQVPSRGCARGNHTLMFLSLPFFLPSPLSLKFLSLKECSFLLS